MAENEQNTMRDNLVKLLLPGVAHDRARTDQVMRVIDRIADSNDTFAVGFLNKLLRAAVSNDVFDAVGEWRYLNDFQAPPVPKGKRRKTMATGGFFPAELCDGYYLQNTVEPQRVVPVGEQSYRRMIAEFRDFGKPDSQRWMLAKNCAKRTRKKKDVLDKMLQNPGQTLEQVLSDPKGYKELKRIDSLDRLNDTIRSQIALLGTLHDSAQEILDQRDHSALDDDVSEYLVSLEDKRGFMTYFREENTKGNLPETIRNYYKQLRDDALECAQFKVAALFIYYAKNAHVDRKSIVGRVEDDLGFLGSLPDDSPISERYGKIDLTPVADLRRKKAITLLDATRILEVKPDIARIRVEVNKEVAATYDEDLGAVIEKVRPIFMTDKFVWHEDFRKGKGSERTGKSLYSKALNRGDYGMIKSLLRRATITPGDLVDNFARGYSMREFRRTCEDLVVLGRRLKLVERLAAERGVDTRNVYDVDPAALEKMEAADLKVAVRDRKGNLKIKPAEYFSTHKKNISGQDLQDVVAIIAMARPYRSGNYHFNQFRRNHLPRIMDMATAGLFHDGDVERLDHYFRTVAQHSVSRTDDEEMGFISAMIGKARENPLVEVAEDLPELGKRFYRKSGLSVLRRVAELYSSFEALVGEHGGLAEHKRRLALLKGIVEQGNVYSGKLSRNQFNDRDRFEIHAKALDMKSLKAGWLSFGADVNYYKPDKVAEKAAEFETGHTTLAALYESDPDARKKLETLAGMADHDRGAIKKHLMMPDAAFDDLQTLVGSNNHDKVYLSNELVKDMGRAYDALQQGLVADPQYTVDTSVLYPEAEALYNGSKGDEHRQYILLILKGRGSSKTYQHRQWLRDNGFRWIAGKGFVRNYVGEEDLADFTHVLAERNSQTGSTMKLNLK